jgi:beta-N-acetylhexosaminidase
VNDPTAAFRLSRRRVLRSLTAAGLAFVAPSASHAAQDDTDLRIAAMTPRERAARMFMLPIAGTSLTAEQDAWLRDLKPGGVILAYANIGSPEEVRALVAAIHATNPDLPPLVAVDQEGGIVSRIAGDPAPDAPTLGTLPAADITALARARADMLAGYGFDVNFAPVADVAFAPDSVMADRVFGSDPQTVAAAVVAYLAGAVGSGVVHCVKHFPGHGRVAVDSHEALPVLEVDPALWWDADALPFRAAVDVDVPMVMLGHLAPPAWDDLPASLSPAIVRLLRQDLGFAGVVVTDDLGMGALAAWDPLQIVDLALAAGDDLLLYVIAPDAPETLVDHLAGRVERGEIAPERVRESVARLLRLRAG